MATLRNSEFEWVRRELTITRLVGAILLEQNDEWSVQRARYLTLGTMTTLSR